MQTIAEKIFSDRIGRAVVPGEIIVAPIDFAYSHDGNRPQPCEVSLDLGGDPIIDRDRVAMFLDHAPNTHTPAAAEMHRRMREFASGHKIRLFPAGRGISHQIVTEEGIAVPGRIVVGSDSHTCTAGAFNCLATGVGSTDLAIAMKLGRLWFKVPETIRLVIDGELPAGVYSKDLILHLISLIGEDGATYCSVEYLGSTIATLTMEERLTLTNMAIEMGAKFGLMEADETTAAFLEARGVDGYKTYTSDPGATVKESYKVAATDVTPMVSLPPSPGNVAPVSDVAGRKIHQATIGTCTNGRLSDLRAASEILGSRPFHPDVTVYLTAASSEVFAAARAEGIIDQFAEAGALIGTPGCSGCTGGSGFGIPADGTRMISTAPRNFTGRTGNDKAEIYLASPATVVASAIEGAIADPRQFVGAEGHTSSEEVSA